MQTSLRGIANRAASHKKHRFGSLYGLLNEENLAWCFEFLRKDAAPGVDRLDYVGYQRHLDSNIHDLVERLKTNRYLAKLVKRRYIPKLNGKMRPLGIPTTEDKLVQVAVAKILDAIYEQDFLGMVVWISPSAQSTGCSNGATPFAPLWKVLLGG
ncbi:MAG: hypothetical protein ACLPVO_06310 [Desulfomonilaceae bacterium]